MGLAIIGIAFYHAPFIIHDPYFRLFHSCLNCGVDMFLFLSGLGACHSIARRGGGDYLRQRARRLLPGLYLFLIPWSLIMLIRGFMTGWQFVGSVTLLGWWIGCPVQLNWYFSAVWMFFLLAIPLYALFRRVRFPALLWAGLVLLSAGLAAACPLDHLMTAVSRLPIFLTGMLFGVLEQRGFRHTWPVRILLWSLIPAGIWLTGYVQWGDGGTLYGYRYGMWWYPYALMIPGYAVLLADLSALLERSRILAAVLRPVRLCGESSAEILMFHVGIYKSIMYTNHFRNRVWVCIMLGCIALGCLYHSVVLPFLGRKIKRFLPERY